MAIIKASDDTNIERQVGALLNKVSQAKTVRTILGTHDREVVEPESEGFVRPAVVELRDGRARLLVAPGQILVNAEHADRAKKLLGRSFSTPEPISCGCGPDLPVVRFRTKSANLAKACDDLHSAGIPANFSHITPSGPWIKGDGGPEFPHGSTPTRPRTKAASGRIRVAVIDTGLNLDETGWATGLLAATTAPRRHRDPLNAISGSTLDRGAGHGTFVAGVIRQVAPACQLSVYRALDSDGLGSEEAVACAILQAAADGADIINLSLGSESYRDRPPVALGAALELLPDNVVVVAAAGNDGTSRPNWPAAFKRVVAVAGLDRQLQPSPWSNRGSWIDFSTVGEGVVSTFVVGIESIANDPAPERFKPTMPWAMWTGTSFAAPQVAGLIARAAEGSDARTALASLRGGGTHLADWGIAIASPLNYVHA